MKRTLSIILTAILLVLTVAVAVPSFAAESGHSERMSYIDANDNEYIWQEDLSAGPMIVSVITEVHNVSGELVLPTYLVDISENRDGGDQFYFADSAFATVNPDIPITLIDFSRMYDNFGFDRFMNNIDHFMDVCPTLQTIIGRDVTYIKKDGAFQIADNTNIDERLIHTDINGNELIWGYDQSEKPSIVTAITEVHNVSGELVLPTYLVDISENRDGGDQFYFADSAFATVNPDIPITLIDFSRMYDNFGFDRFMNNIDHFMDVCPTLQTIIGRDDTYVKKDGTFCPVTNPVIETKCGDIDGDGDITILDATFIQRRLVEIPVPFEFNDEIADTDGDMFVTIIDATLIQRWLVGFNKNSRVGETILA